MTRKDVKKLRSKLLQWNKLTDFSLQNPTFNLTSLFREEIIVIVEMLYLNKIFHRVKVKGKRSP